VEYRILHLCSCCICVCKLGGICVPVGEYLCRSHDIPQYTAKASVTSLTPILVGPLVSLDILVTQNKPNCAYCNKNCLCFVRQFQCTIW
jgi:hypothetical protein